MYHINIDIPNDGENNDLVLPGLEETLTDLLDLLTNPSIDNDEL